MEVHANARLTPRGRLAMVRRTENENWTLDQAASAFGVSEKTCRKWLYRYRMDGDPGLDDRPSRPRWSPTEIAPDRVAAIAALRRIRFTGAEIALILDMPISTVSVVLRRIGLGKLSRLERPEPPNAYGAIYCNSAERINALDGWLHFYNWERPHGFLAKRPPGERLAQLNRNNVPGTYN